MSIFGEETITAPTSPEGQGEGAAVVTETQEVISTEEDNQEIETQEGADELESHEDEEDSSPGVGQGEELIDGKFKTQEDLLAAYHAAQRKITEQSQQLKGTQQPGQQQSPAQPQTSPQQPADLNDVFWGEFEKDPMGTLRYLIQSATEQSIAPILQKDQNKALANNIETVAKDYAQIRTPDGMQQLMGKVAEIAKDDFGNPNLANNPSPRLLKLAAEELFGSTKAQLYKQAKDKGRMEAEETRRNKQGLGAPNGVTKQKPPEGPKTEAERIREGILSAGKGSSLFG